MMIVLGNGWQFFRLLWIGISDPTILIAAFIMETHHQQLDIILCVRVHPTCTMLKVKWQRTITDELTVLDVAYLSFLSITAQNIDHTLKHRRARLINLCLGVIRESEATTNLLANEIEQQGLVSVLGRAQDQNCMILCFRIRVNSGRG